MTDILIVIAAFAVGGVIAWLLRGSFAKVNIATLEARLESSGQQQAEKVHELAALKIEHGRVQQALSAESERRAASEVTAARLPALETSLAAREQELTEHKSKLSALETRLAEERKAADAKLALLDEAQQKLSDAFKALSSEALKSNNQAFLDLAKGTLEKFQQVAKSDLEARQKAVDEMVKPIRESLEKVDGKLGEIEKARVGAYAELSTQVKGLVETHLPMLRNETAISSRRCASPPCAGAGEKFN